MPGTTTGVLTNLVPGAVTSQELAEAAAENREPRLLPGQADEPEQADLPGAHLGPLPPSEVANPPGKGPGPTTAPLLLNQMADDIGETRNLTLADQLAEGRPFTGVPQPLRRQIRKRRLR